MVSGLGTKYKNGRHVTFTTITSPQPKGREAMPTKKKSKYLYYKNQLTQGVTAKFYTTVYFTELCGVLCFLIILNLTNFYLTRFPMSTLL